MLIHDTHIHIRNTNTQIFDGTHSTIPCVAK